MSWASRRRAAYGLSTGALLLVVIGGPILYSVLSTPPTCTDGKKNGGETSVDKGGPCPLLDERMLSPHALLWSRSFRVRDGSYNAVAVIHNPNKNAGVRAVAYRFGLYDSNNVLVAERIGKTYLMPGGITPIFEGAIETGQRIATRTQFEFLEPLQWERLDDVSNAIRISERRVEGENTSPKITVRVENTSVYDLANVTFIATVSSPTGNAFAASQTTLEQLRGGASDTIVFTWPDPFAATIASIEVTALVPPVPPRQR